MGYNLDEPEGILSETSQSQKDESCMIPPCDSTPVPSQTESDFPGSLPQSVRARSRVAVGTPMMSSISLLRVPGLDTARTVRSYPHRCCHFSAI